LQDKVKAHYIKQLFSDSDWELYVEPVKKKITLYRYTLKLGDNFCQTSWVSDADRKNDIVKTEQKEIEVSE